ncbi:pyrroline-5-carboxylate reductase [Bifidobacterium primatium]|uniref:Pyrroline-5-carboxylate reductase n=2 Tax=Bifidobacterium TaxID=1678 RepID=A0A2M9HA52_9BIFI|nr:MULTISPECIES: pyrroline-5-carboxylate reductase [Bifidobacterium]NEG95892.1 pyrroline-5-carboxylate reductase [Bifidobacterium sp. SMB2]NEH11739.1 pyrroline-5-carboxylate reductase [Bifidobacterium saimiriisciurei]PJM73696.1 pyrroline-5-carboxylate reductase [Bifidobacterium primatium]
MAGKHIGVIGFGNMGGAIIGGAIEHGVVAPGDVTIYDPNADKNAYAKELGLNTAASEKDVVAASDMVLLAVKPQMFAAMAAKAGSFDGKAVLSIMAGVTADRVRETVDGTPRVMRLMPNTPALVGAGAFALDSDSDFTDDEKAFAKTLFESLGIVEFVPEHLLDAVTGLSGSAPAFVAMFIEALADGGLKEGLPRATAYRLAAQTCLGEAKLILDKNMTPAAAKDMVTSPAGTTIAGYAVLEEAGFRGTVMKAVSAAARRSREL